MALVIGLTVGLVVTLVASWKTLRWSLNAEKDQLGAQYIGHYAELYKWLIWASLAYVLGPGLAAWAYDAWHVLTTAL